MNRASTLLGLARRPVVLLGVIGLAVVIVVWLLVFFLPQGHKLSSLQSKKATLQEAVIQDNARLKVLRTESHHVGEIKTLYVRLQGYVPSSEDLYTYIQSISGAGKATGVKITSLEPSAEVTASTTSYTVVPITANVKGTYDNLLGFLHAIYKLPRLTDINSLTINGGGPGTNRSTLLSVTLDLAIFTSQKASTSS
jgi:Tfp pilus assembly protein PilO